MNQVRAALEIAKTEFVASVRDRMTIVYTFVMPLAMYPVLFWIMIQGYVVLQGKDERTAVSVAVVGLPETIDATRLTSALGSAPKHAEVSVEPEQDVAEPDDEDVEPEFVPGVVELEYLDALPAERDALVTDDADHDLVLHFLDDGTTELLYDASRSRSVLAKRRIDERSAHLAEVFRREALEREGTTLEAFDPLDYEVVDLADEKDVVGLLFSLILPMMFVIMTVLGGFYPAVDTTAGEKERKTAETTALLPLAPATIVWGKVLAVAAFAAIAAMLNILGMALAAEHLLSSMGEGLGVEIDPPFAALGRMAPFALSFVLFTSCVLVASASLTRTFKQGQSLLGAVQMVFIFPAVLGTMPVFDLSVTNAWIPIVQTSVAFKALLQGESAPASANALAFSIVFVTGILYACIAVWLTIRLRQTEELFSDSFDPKSLLPFKKKPAPTAKA